MLLVALLIKAVRVWEEIHDVEEPETPSDLLASFEGAHAEGELDDAEFARVERQAGRNLDREPESTDSSSQPRDASDSGRIVRLEEHLDTLAAADSGSTDRIMTSIAAGWIEPSQCDLFARSQRAHRVDARLRFADECHELGHFADRPQFGLDSFESRVLRPCPRDRGS